VNSLLTGNFTGNFSILRLYGPISEQESAVLQSLLGQFPTQINRENISVNREYFASNREFATGMPFKATFAVSNEQVRTDRSWEAGGRIVAAAIED
jgi:hypothetical protein